MAHPTRHQALHAGFGRRTINPDPGHSLAGYFNERPNQGVLDDLHVSVLLLKQGEQIVGMASYDLVILSDELVALVREALRAKGHAFADTLPLCATHTHTGPDVGGIFDLKPRQMDYLRRVARATAEAVEDALADMAAAELRHGAVEENPFVFNRRYWMKDGRVVTNPGKGNPNVVKPEGPVDRQIHALAVMREGKPYCLVANISNHTDTTSGDLASADWPGHLERAVGEALGASVPVITLIAPAGNVNHVNIAARDEPVYGVDLSQRIGRGYAEILLRALKSARPVTPGPLSCVTRRIIVGKRAISLERIERARAIMSEAVDSSSGDLTSEDLARGSKAIERVFAGQLLAYLEQTPDAGRPFDLAALRIGKDVAMVFLPGEPFVQIAQAIREASPFAATLVASLANGECGYVAMKECFDRGGYEVLPVVGGGPAEDTAERMIAESGKLLRA